MPHDLAEMMYQCAEYIGKLGQSDFQPHLTATQHLLTGGVYHYITEHLVVLS